MSETHAVNVATSALLMLDMQVGIVDLALDTEGMLARAGKALGAARKAGMTVIHVGIGYRDGYPEISERNKMFIELKRNKIFQAQPYHPTTAAIGGEPVITKRRVSAFFGTELDSILRAAGITDLYLIGFASSGVVLSTLRQAADLDYAVFVLSDCCDDFDPAVQACLVDKVFPMQATVLTGDAFAGALGAIRKS